MEAFIFPKVIFVISMFHFFFKKEKKGLLILLDEVEVASYPKTLCSFCITMYEVLQLCFALEFHFRLFNMNNSARLGSKSHRIVTLQTPTYGFETPY